jgi:hypothetical protein
MEALSKTLTKEHMEGLAPALRRTVETTSTAGNDIAGFCRPGGLKPVLPILIQGLLAGTNEQREQSAYGLGDIVERTATDALKPHVTQITGYVDLYHCRSTTANVQPSPAHLSVLLLSATHHPSKQRFCQLSPFS